MKTKNRIISLLLIALMAVSEIGIGCATVTIVDTPVQYEFDSNDDIDDVVEWLK